MSGASVRKQILARDADNLAVWVSIAKGGEPGLEKEKIGLLNAELQAICNEHISTLDDKLEKKSPRPNPTPHIFIEQGNEFSRILWLRWES